MATRAQQFRTETQRSAQNAKPRPIAKKAPSKKQLAVDEMLAERSGTHTAERNFSLRVTENKAGTALEDSATTPSRRSTRGSANHGRPSAQLERRQKRATHAPETVSSRAAAQSVRVRGHSA
ncbi:MAG TPA: hypothetical protein VFQ61_28640 [Polyangiaceae bacterium]|nr:hypothetical protein [Polyangiaceae bacterium]